jgi:hypothetical protein
MTIARRPIVEHLLRDGLVAEKILFKRQGFVVLFISKRQKNLFKILVDLGIVVNDQNTLAFLRHCRVLF